MEQSQELLEAKVKCSCLSDQLEMTKRHTCCENNRVYALITFLFGAKDPHEERDKLINDVLRERSSLLAQVWSLEDHTASYHVLENEVNALKEQLQGYCDMLD